MAFRVDESPPSRVDDAVQIERFSLANPNIQWRLFGDLQALAKDAEAEEEQELLWPHDECGVSQARILYLISKDKGSADIHDTPDRDKTEEDFYGRRPPSLLGRLSG